MKLFLKVHILFYSWIDKFGITGHRMERNFNRDNQRSSERCGYYDEANLPHSGPARKRRDDEDDFDVERYNREV